MSEQNEAIALYLEALNRYNEGNCDETLDFLHEATEAARGTDDFDLLQKIYNLTAATYESKTRCFSDQAVEIQMLEKAIKALQREKHLHRDKKDEEAEIVTIFDLCRIIERIRPYSEELEELYQEATKLAQKSNNQSLLCKSWRRLGEYYMLRGRNLRLQLATLKDTVEKKLLINSSFSEAVTSYQTASDIARANLFNDEIGFLTGDLANAYYEQGIYQKASELYEERFRIAEGEKDRCAMRRTYSALGNINRKIGRNDEATKYYRLALAIACELDDRKSMIMQYISLGELKMEEVDWDDAIMYAQKAINGSRQVNDLETEAQAYRLMAEIHLTRLNYSKAAYCLAVLRHLSKKLDRQEQVNYAHEQLCRLRNNQLEEVDGRLILDSSDDPHPYRIGLSASLTSLNDSFSLSPETIQSLGILTPVSSQSFQRDAQHDDYYSKLEKVASWKIEEQQEQVQIQSVKRVEASRKRRSSLLSWLRF